MSSNLFTLLSFWRSGFEWSWSFSERKDSLWDFDTSKWALSALSACGDVDGLSEDEVEFMLEPLLLVGLDIWVPAAQPDKGDQMVRGGKTGWPFSSWQLK